MITFRILKILIYTTTYYTILLYFIFCHILTTFILNCISIYLSIHYINLPAQIHVWTLLHPWKCGLRVLYGNEWIWRMNMEIRNRLLWNINEFIYSRWTLILRPWCLPRSQKYRCDRFHLIFNPHKLMVRGMVGVSCLSIGSSTGEKYFHPLMMQSAFN